MGVIAGISGINRLMRESPCRLYANVARLSVCTQSERIRAAARGALTRLRGVYCATR